MSASFVTAKLILIRLTGVFAIAVGLIGVFLALNPATAHRLSRYALVYDAIAFAIGVGLLLLRKWAAVTFVLLVACAAVFIVREAFRPDIWRPAIYINLALLALPTWACTTAWRQLRW